MNVGLVGEGVCAFFTKVDKIFWTKFAILHIRRKFAILYIPVMSLRSPSKKSTAKKF